MVDRSTLEAALIGFQVELDRIDAAIIELKRRIRGAGLKNSDVPDNMLAKPRRKLSAAARKRIAAAQKKRWAAVRKAKG